MCKPRGLVNLMLGYFIKVSSLESRVTDRYLSRIILSKRWLGSSLHNIDTLCNSSWVESPKSWFESLACVTPSLQVITQHFAHNGQVNFPEETEEEYYPATSTLFICFFSSKVTHMESTNIVKGKVCLYQTVSIEDRATNLYFEKKAFFPSLLKNILPWLVFEKMLLTLDENYRTCFVLNQLLSMFLDTCPKYTGLWIPPQSIYVFKMSNKWVFIFYRIENFIFNIEDFNSLNMPSTISILTFTKSSIQSFITKCHAAVFWTWHNT